MGCDIHMYVERRNSATAQWEKLGNVFENPYQKYDGEAFCDQPYTGRNYNLFAMLADVRNGRGFGGIKTGEGFNPISEPKGLPVDVSPEIQAMSDDWDIDGHSHSWLTVAELLAYNWDQLTMEQGVISLDEYKVRREQGGMPETGWSGWVSGGQVVVLSEEDASAFLDGKLTQAVPAREPVPAWYDRTLPAPEVVVLEGKNLFVHYRWGSSYRDSASSFLEHTMPLLQGLGAPDDVRIVFWFDN